VQNFWRARLYARVHVVCLVILLIICNENKREMYVEAFLTLPTSIAHKDGLVPALNKTRRHLK
jgi:hypothetical protein